MRKSINYLTAFLGLAIMLFPGLLTAQSIETGSFYNFLLGVEPGCAYDNWVTHISERVANPGFNFYAPWDRQTEGFGSFTLPDSIQNRYWEDISLAWCEQRWQSVDDNIHFSGFPYDFVQFFDTDQNREYYILRERLNRAYDDNGTEDIADDEIGSFDFGWGLYVFNPQATSPVIVTVPHPNDDFIATALGWKAFTNLNARYFFINGAGREVAFTGGFYYSNSISLSDPTRNANHPFNLTYIAAANDIRALLSSQGSLLGREFSLQVHSYDSAAHPGRPNCQISSGNSQDCINLPTRDLSLSGNDMINAAGYLIHPAGHLGNPVPVYANNFWTVYNNYYGVNFNDGIHNFNIPNVVDLPGYSQSQQMLYTLAGWNNFDVYDPFFHIEMDELPNCYTQNDSTMAWFYGYEAETQYWNPDTRYQKVQAYYAPWIDALNSVLPDVFLMNDGLTPTAPVISSGSVIWNTYAKLNFSRAYHYDFRNWVVTAEKMIYTGNNTYLVTDTLSFGAGTGGVWADQGRTNLTTAALDSNYTYAFRVGCYDKSNRFSGWSNAINLTIYNDIQYVSDLTYDYDNSDGNQIALSWSVPPDTVVFQSCRVYRRSVGDQSFGDLVATLPPTATHYTDTTFDTDETVYGYQVSMVGLGGAAFESNTASGWLRCYPATRFMEFQWVSDNHLHLSWLPVTNTLGGMDDTPDYYKLSVADNPDMTGAVDYLINTDLDEPDYDLVFPAPLSVPSRLFFSVTAMANDAMGTVHSSAGGD